ncbi:MAG TPA: hypothetical protein VEC16_05135 [Alphaproteobacteria bacterium]|nr:hypothetical protein [Alphaproteobacteria bacterium]
MSNHPRYVEGFNGSLDDLAKAIGNMTYDQAASFLEKLSQDFKRQADGDFKLGRTQLSSLGYKIADKTLEASHYAARAWKISKPYMKCGLEQEYEGDYGLDGF